MAAVGLVVVVVAVVEAEEAEFGRQSGAFFWGWVREVSADC